MDTFHSDEDGYLAWNKNHPVGFVLNHFGGKNPAFNVLHRSDCTFLRRDVDEGSRTVVEKWCSDSEEELLQEANSVLGKEMWKECGICFRRPPSERAIAPEFLAISAPASSDRNVPQDIESLWIDGEPAVWLGSGEKEWKQRVTKAFNALVPSEAPQWLDVEFRFLTDRLYRKDIDNLLTPILESGRDGGWIEGGFAWLGSVTARKVAVADLSDVGVLITARQKPPPLSQNRTGILIEAALPRLDETSVKWALYERAFSLFQSRPDLRFPPQAPMSVEVRVTINDAGKRKSIAALLKPCIDGLEPILGHPTNLLPEPRGTLQRRLAPQDEMVLSLGFHVRGGPATEVSALICPLQTAAPGVSDQSSNMHKRS